MIVYPLELTIVERASAVPSAWARDARARPGIKQCLRWYIASPHALRLMAARDRQLAELDSAVERSRADIEAGRTKPIEAVADRLRAKYTRMAQERGEL